MSFPVSIGKTTRLRSTGTLSDVRWLDAPSSTGIDLYVLSGHSPQGRRVCFRSRGRRNTALDWHANIPARINGWDWNGEGVIQFGTFGSESILAWTASLDSGYTFDAPWKPRLGVKLDVASGNSHPGDGRLGTFDALYFKSGYFNDASLLRPENIMDIHPTLTVNPTSKITIDGGVDVFRRYSRNDGVYSVGGPVEIPAIPGAPLFLGTACDVNLGDGESSAT